MIEATDYRPRLNYVCALNLSNISAIVLKIKKEHYPFEQKGHITLNRTDYHRSQLIKVSATILNIELHYLPPYNPNLNPIE